MAIFGYIGVFRAGSGPATNNSCSLLLGISAVPWRLEEGIRALGCSALYQALRIA